MRKIHVSDSNTLEQYQMANFDHYLVLIEI
jgi:hypothetical protein